MQILKMPHKLPNVLMAVLSALADPWIAMGWDPWAAYALIKVATNLTIL